MYLVPSGAGRGRCLAAALLCLLLAGAIGGRVRAEVRPLTLYEKVGRAPLVVWGEVTDGTHRLAVVRTLEVLHCAIPERPAETFRIAFRLDSFLRKPWEEKIEFATGERVILFLRKFTREDGDQPEGDIYTLMWGAQGRYELPPEGEAAHVEAARLFAGIVSEKDLDEQARRLRAATGDRNPLVSDGAAEQMLKEGLGDAEMIPELVARLESPREPTRILSMRLLRQILDDSRVSGRPVPNRQELTDLIRGRATHDGSAGFRVEAVRALHALGGEDVKAFLERLAREDPSQMVRYEAEKSLLGWSGGP